MNKALLDTDIFIEVTKGINKKVIIKSKEYKLIYRHYTTSVITVMEMVKGFWKKKLLDDLSAFTKKLQKIEVLNFEIKESDLAGRIYADLESTGQTIGKCDPMIAAIAISNGLTLVTGNTKHYDRIVELGYELELDNWKE